MPTFEPIETERLIIRPVVQSDAEELWRRRNLPEVGEYQAWVLPYPRERCEELVAEVIELGEPTNHEWFMTTITTADDGTIVGDLGIYLEWQGRAAEIGYTLSSEHWGHGYATEASNAVLDWLFDVVGVTRVRGMTHPDNVASVMVLERLGFRYEGYTRNSFWVGEENSDDLIFGLTPADRDEWRNRSRDRPNEVGLVEITPETHRSVADLVTHRSQERFVAPNLWSFANALFPRGDDGDAVVPWYRAIEADGELVGFIMTAEPRGDDPAYLWRLMVDRLHQGRGIGTRAVEQVIDQSRAWGADALLVSWVEGRGSPRSLYERLGFVPTGNVHDGETEARLELNAS